MDGFPCTKEIAKEDDHNLPAFYLFTHMVDKSVVYLTLQISKSLLPCFIG